MRSRDVGSTYDDGRVIRCYYFTMSCDVLPPFQRLREDLEDALAQADALNLPLVAIKISEALAGFGLDEDGEASKDS